MSVVSGWLIPLLVGAATGVLSGFGVGGGTLLLLYMTSLAGVRASICCTFSPPDSPPCPPT